MKKYAKDLVAFCTKNANNIKQHTPQFRDEMMNSRDFCVLRPQLVPLYILKQMSDAEYVEYSRMASFFYNKSHINRALKWVKDWVKQ